MQILVFEFYIQNAVNIFLVFLLQLQRLVNDIEFFCQLKFFYNDFYYHLEMGLF